MVDPLIILLPLINNHTPWPFLHPSTDHHQHPQHAL
jgi:hypothetical protein